MQLHLRHRLHPRGPVILEISNALLLALAPDAFMKVDRLADALFEGETPCPKGLELSNVGRVRRRVTSERPQLLDLVLPHPHHSGANRRRQKFVQARPKIIAVQIGHLEVEQPERMGPVGHHFNAVRVRHIGDLRHRHRLPHPVHHMRHMDDPCTRRDGLFIRPDNRRIVLNGKIEADLLVDDAVPLGTLPVGLNHVRVILLRANHLVAGLKRQPVNNRIQRLGRIPVDGDLPRFGSGQIRQLLPQRLPPLIEDLPHVIGRPFVRKLVVALHRLLHYDGRGRNPAVVQVDDVRVDRIGALDHAPVVLILNDFSRGQVAHRARCRLEVCGVGLAEEAVDGKCARQGGGALQKRATVARSHGKNCRPSGGRESNGNQRRERSGGRPLLTK